MSWVAGCDYSTHYIDVVLVDEDYGKPPVWHRHKLEGPDAWERTRQVRYWQLQWADAVVAVGLEQPRGHGAGSLYRVQGALLARLPGTVLVQPWLPNEWRKRVGLPGNAKKEAIAVFAGQHRGNVIEHWPQDACDAWCIAVATRQALETQPQPEA